MNQNISTISVLGCGWLGLPLAAKLLEKGYTVNGSTTTPAKLKTMEDMGIKPFLINLNPAPEGDNIADFLQADSLIIDFPPGVRFGTPEDFYHSQLKELMKHVQQSPLKDIIFISTTSVYPELNKTVTEDDADLESPLFKAEELVIELAPNQAVTILRSGGLMGYDRVPVKYFAGAKGLTTGDTQVNYVYRDDAVDAIVHILVNDVENDTFNLVAPQHPTRQDVYMAICETYGYEMPEFVPSAIPIAYNIVSSDKLIENTFFKFKYPNPLDFPYDPKA